MQSEITSSNEIIFSFTNLLLLKENDEKQS
jgi:hypothetical protein